MQIDTQWYMRSR